MAAPARYGFTDEDLALLRHPDLKPDGSADAPERSHGDETYDERSRPNLAGFRERLVLGDISWAKTIGSALLAHVFGLRDSERRLTPQLLAH